MADKEIDEQLNTAKRTETLGLLDKKPIRESMNQGSEKYDTELMHAKELESRPTYNQALLVNVEKQGDSELMHERDLHSRPTYNEALLANVENQGESELMHERELLNRPSYNQAIMANIDTKLKQESDYQTTADKELS